MGPFKALICLMGTGKPGRNANNRLFIDALFVDGPFGRALARIYPERFGRFDSVKRRYYLWVEAGVLEDVFKALRTHADQEWLMMDATIVRAHAQAAGARHKKGGPDAHALGRSKGGLTTKYMV